MVGLAHIISLRISEFHDHEVLFLNRKRLRDRSNGDIYIVNAMIESIPTRSSYIHKIYFLWLISNAVIWL